MGKEMKVYSRKFKYVIENFEVMGLTVSNSKGCVGISIYDYETGEVLMERFMIDDFYARRLFGGLDVYGAQPLGDYIHFTLCAPEWED